MHKEEIRFTYVIHVSTSSLSSDDQALLAEATKACKNAYAPYSQFKVGVAIRNTDGTVTPGSNQENGAFPIGQCAERVALYSMVSAQGRKPIDTIAIMVENENQIKPASPCGSCRQILNEYRSFQTNHIRVILGLTKGGELYEIGDVRDLLPFAFDGSFLGL